MVLANGDRIDVEDLPEELGLAAMTAPSGDSTPPGVPSLRSPGAGVVEHPEDLYLVEVHAIDEQERSSRYDELARAPQPTCPAQIRVRRQALGRFEDPIGHRACGAWVVLRDVLECFI